MSMVLTFTKKQDLIDALQARREEFQRIDQERMTQHTQAEKDYLAEFREACKQALKWDYQTAKANYFNVEMSETKGRNNRYGAPTCPHSLEKRLDNILTHLRQTRQERFTLERRGRWSDIYDLLMAGQLDDVEMC